MEVLHEPVASAIAIVLTDTTPEFAEHSFGVLEGTSKFYFHTHSCPHLSHDPGVLDSKLCDHSQHSIIQRAGIATQAHHAAYSEPLPPHRLDFSLGLAYCTNILQARAQAPWLEDPSAD